MMSIVAGGSTPQEALDRFLRKLEDRFLRKLNEFLHEQKEWREQQERNGSRRLPTAAEWFATEQQVLHWDLMVAMWTAIVAAGFSFLISTKATGFDTHTFNKISPWVVSTFFAVFGIIILWHIGRFLVVRRCCRKGRSSSSSTEAPANHGSV
ncbi:hypothetical protein Nepgr_009085 [Nepenthes gracilis]|uniref:Transmembrane protein n=1 Tax=Nepenthes gracilis TaxID=150966 RepID=A0AAD3XK18_NEPGR|nr:hypothetical protein Nepgr_009085 [Nepenthes gracilis]